MFSSNELLQFVFGDEMDTYYCRGAISLDFKQYLWLKLHESGYKRILFLEMSGDILQIKTFSEKDFQKIGGKTLMKKFKSLLLGKKNDIIYWIMNQLGEKQTERTAVVCSLQDFCTYFSSGEYKDSLHDLAVMGKRTGTMVLTVPVEVECSREYFLGSPVFEYLHDNGIVNIRTAANCDMYATMFHYNPDRMIFLSTYTAERIHNIFDRIFLEEPQRFLELSVRKEMEDFIFQWMNNKEFRDLTTARERYPSHELLFKELFRWLKKSDNWNRLAAKAMQVSQTGGMAGYLRNMKCTPVYDFENAVSLRRKPGSYADRCMRLHLNLSKYNNSKEYERMNELVESIHTRVKSSLNHTDNTLIKDEILRFLDRLITADRDGDEGTVRRILDSIDFCAAWIWVEKQSQIESDVLTIVKQLKEYVDCSDAYGLRLRSLEIAKKSSLSGNHKLTVYAVKQQEIEIVNALRVLNVYEDVIQASILNLASATTATISEIAKSLPEEIVRQKEAAEKESEPLTFSYDEKREWEMTDEIDDTTESEDEDELGLSSSDLVIDFKKFSKK